MLELDSDILCGQMSEKYDQFVAFKCFIECHTTWRPRETYVYLLLLMAITKEPLKLGMLIFEKMDRKHICRFCRKYVFFCNNTAITSLRDN